MRLLGYDRKETMYRAHQSWLSPVLRVMLLDVGFAAGTSVLEVDHRTYRHA